MSWQVCPLCQGSGSQGTYQVRCEVCDGHKIIDEQTGQPPSITQRLQNDKSGRPYPLPQNLTGE